MHLTCAICSDLVNQSDELLATKCGHIFHYVCLTQWLERSKSCPQCRNKVTEKCMFRVFPSMNTENSEVDSTTLQSQLDDAQLQIREGLIARKEQVEKLQKVNKELENATELVKKLENKAVKRESAIGMLKEQLTHLKEKELLVTVMQKENETMKKEMLLLNNVQKVLGGTEDEVQSILNNNQDVRTLATFASALKQALYDCEERRKEMRQRLHSLEVELHNARQTNQRLQREVDEARSDKHTRCNVERVRDKENKIVLKKRTVEDLGPKCNKMQQSDDQQNSNNADMHKSLSPDRKRPKNLDDAIIMEDSDVDSTHQSCDHKNESTSSPYLSLESGAIHLPYKLTGIVTQLRPTGAKQPGASASTSRSNDQFVSTSIFRAKIPLYKQNAVLNEGMLEASYDGMGGREKPDVFPRCIPRRTARHRLKPPPADTRPNYDISKMLHRLRD